MMNAKQAKLLQEMLEQPTITAAANAAGISRNTAMKYLKEPEFQEELNKARSECLKETVTFLQGNLKHCSNRLMKIIKDPETSPQVAINAINSVFSNCRGLTETYEIIERMEKIEEALADGGE